MYYFSFLDSDEGSTVVATVQDTIRKACEASTVAAAKDRTMAPYDAQMAYVDLGDGTVQYFVNNEAKSILDQAGVAVGSAKVAETLPTDAVSLIAARHFRHG